MTIVSSTVDPAALATARVKLAHAVVQRVADLAGVDILHIKGYALDPELRYEGRASRDVDVLVRPAQVASLLAALRRSGWQDYASFASGSAFEHSWTLWHETWGFADVHRFFPGITAEPGLAFRVLWRDRMTTDLAGFTCQVPGIAAQTLILVLHSAPRANRERGRQDLAVAWDEAPPERRDAVRALAAELRAEVGFAAALGGLEDYRDRPEYDLWKVLSEGGTRIEEWRARVAAAPGLAAKARLVLRAPLVNVEHLEHTLGHRPARWEIAREFVARPVRGVVEECRKYLGAGERA